MLLLQRRTRCYFGNTLRRRVRTAVRHTVYRDTAASDLIQHLTHIRARLHHTQAAAAAYIERIYYLKDGLQMTSTPSTGKQRGVSR